MIHVLYVLYTAGVASFNFLVFLFNKMFKNVSSGFSPVWQNLSGKFGCLVLSGQQTHMPSPVEPYLIHYFQFFWPHAASTVGIRILWRRKNFNVWKIWSIKKSFNNFFLLVFIKSKLGFKNYSWRIISLLKVITTYVTSTWWILIDTNAF